MHRICSRPVAIPTLLAYLSGKRSAASETLTCCDRKEVWTAQVYDWGKQSDGRRRPYWIQNP